MYAKKATRISEYYTEICFMQNRWLIDEQHIQGFGNETKDEIIHKSNTDCDFTIN